MSIVRTIPEPLAFAPNWLASEIGIRTVSYTLKNADFQADENGKKIIKSGQIIPSNDKDALGILFTPYDIDLTDVDSVVVALMIGGRVIEDRLPQQIDAAAKQALKSDPAFIIFETMPIPVQQNQEYVASVPLAAPENLAYDGDVKEITWNPVVGAVSYEVYFDNDVENPLILNTPLADVSEFELGAHTIVVIAVGKHGKGNPAVLHFTIEGQGD